MFTPSKTIWTSFEANLSRLQILLLGKGMKPPRSFVLLQSDMLMFSLLLDIIRPNISTSRFFSDFGPCRCSCTTFKQVLLKV